MPFPPSRNRVSASIDANSTDIAPLRRLETITEAISAKVNQLRQFENTPGPSGDSVPDTPINSKDPALETDEGFQVGTESFANINEIAVTPKSQKGVSSRVYENTATANQGAISIDLHLTLIDTFDENGNKTTGTSKQLPVTFSDYFGAPILLARRVGSSARGFEGHTAQIQVEFFDSGCGKPLNVIGDFTVRDIDFVPNDGKSTGTGAESVTAVSTQILSYELSSEPATAIITEENNGQTRFTNYQTNGGPEDQERWVRIRFHGKQSLNLTFGARNGNTGYGLSTAEFSVTPVSHSQQLQNSGALNSQQATSNEKAVPKGVPKAVHSPGNLDANTKQRSASEVRARNAGVHQNGNYGSIVISSNGSYVYNLNRNKANAALPTQQKIEETFDYTVSDPRGGFSSASLKIVIADTDIASFSGGTIPPQTDRNSVNSLDISKYFSFPSGQTPTYSAKNLPNGLLIDPSTGRITGQLNNNSQRAVGGIFNVEVTATTPSGSVSTTFDWKIANWVPAQGKSEAETGESSASLGRGCANDKESDSLRRISSTTNGSFSYSADPVCGGTDAFEFEFVNEEGATATAKVRVSFGATSTANTPPPVVDTAIPDQCHLASDKINVDISNNFSAADAKRLSFDAIGLPPGLSINSAGTISGTIDSAAAQKEPYAVVILADDRNGGTVTDTFGWAISSPGLNAGHRAPARPSDNIRPSENNIVQSSIAGANEAPTVTTNIPDQTHTQGCAINVDISPNFRAHPSNGLTFSATGLPPGLAITSTGKISGTIVASSSDVAAYAVVIRAKGTDGQFVSDTFSWIISRATTASGCQSDSSCGETTFKLLTDPNCGSVVFSSDGCFTYTPDSCFNGSDKFEYQKLDANGAVSPVTVTIDIISVGSSSAEQKNLASPSQAEVARAIDADAGVAINGEYGTVQINTDGSHTYALDSSNPAVKDLVDGLDSKSIDSISPADATGNSVLTETFQYSFATEGGGRETTAVTITVNKINRAPLLESLLDQSNLNSDTVLVDLTSLAAGLDAESLSFAVTGLPPGLSVSNGVVTGSISPNASTGPYRVSVTVSDRTGGIAMENFDWTIRGQGSSSSGGSLITRDDSGSASGRHSVSLITTAPKNGIVVVNHDGSVTYTPSDDGTKADWYEYEAFESADSSNVAVVRVYAAPVSGAAKSNNAATNKGQSRSLLQSGSSSKFSKPHLLQKTASSTISRT